MSKLAALAAARKKKENEKQIPAESQGSNASITMLEKLGNRAHEDSDVKSPASSRSEDTSSVAIQNATLRQTLRYPSKGREPSPTASPDCETPEEPSHFPSATKDASQEAFAKSTPKAAPSSFAKTMFGPSQDYLSLILEPFQSLDLAVLQPHTSTKAKYDPFAGPSPDDVVMKAQSSSKGSARKAERK